MAEPTRISPSLFWKCSHSQEELHSPRGHPPFEEDGSDGLGEKVFTFTFQCEAVQNRSAKSRREASQQVGLVSGRGAGLPEICSSHRPVRGASDTADISERARKTTKTGFLLNWGCCDLHTVVTQWGPALLLEAVEKARHAWRVGGSS